jgi:hypothetical protein
MSISSVGAATVAAQYSTKTASDGDSAAVEASESGATVQAEKLNGGFQPKASATTVPATPTGSSFSTIA